MFIAKNNLDYIVNTLRELNFNDSQIKRMLFRFSQYQEDLSELKESFYHYAEIMKAKGLNEYQTIELAIYRPRLIFRKYSKNKNIRENYLEYVETLPDEENVTIDFESMEHEKIIEILTELGLSEHAINNILNYNCEVAYMNPETLRNNIKFYLDNGFSKTKFASMAASKYSLLLHGEDDYKPILNELHKLNVTTEEFLSMINTYSRFIDYSLDGLLSTVKWFTSKKFPKEIIKKSLIKVSQVLNASAEHLEEKYTQMNYLGFTEEELNYIISKNISCLTTEIEVLIEKKNKLLEIGFADEEACYIIYVYPDYFSMSINNIEEKLAAMKESNTLRNLLDNPKNLIQSAELTRARYYHFVSESSEILENPYWRILYSGEKLFYRRFKRDNKEIVAKYEKKLSPNG